MAALNRERMLDFLAAYGLPGSPSIEEAKTEFPRLYQRQLENAREWLNKEYPPHKSKKDEIIEGSTTEE